MRNADLRNAIGNYRGILNFRFQIADFKTKAARGSNCRKIGISLINTELVRLAVSLPRFHERFILKRLPYVPHERNCLHLGEQRGTRDVFKAHRKHPFRSVDRHRVEHVPAAVEGEVGLVALYDVLNRELHLKSPERI